MTSAGGCKEPLSLKSQSRPTSSSKSVPAFVWQNNSPNTPINNTEMQVFIIFIKAFIPVNAK
jgi:hypothetical protein